MTLGNSRIDGTTQLYVQVGHPVEHVRSPEAFNSFFVQHGLRIVMIVVDVLPQNLAAFVHSARDWRNLVGMAITMPHKTAMVDLVDVLDVTALDSLAINAVRRNSDGRLVGAMFDGVGYVDGLAAAGHSVAGRNVAIAGAGGTARAIAFAVARAGAARLTIMNRTPETARVLVADLRARANFRSAYVGAPTLDDHIVINATSLGMRLDDQLPFDVSGLAPGTVVGEVVMSPDVTPLLASARDAGLVVHKGTWMRDAQLARHVNFLDLTTQHRT